MGAILKQVLREVEQKKLSHLELASRMGISRPMVTQILGGKKKLTEYYVEKFCAALGLQVDELFARVEERRQISEYDLYPAERAVLHRKLEDILKHGDPEAGWISGNILTFHEKLVARGEILEEAASKKAQEPHGESLEEEKGA